MNSTRSWTDINTPVFRWTSDHFTLFYFRIVSWTIWSLQSTSRRSEMSICNQLPPESTYCYSDRIRRQKSSLNIPNPFRGFLSLWRPIDELPYNLLLSWTESSVDFVEIYRSISKEGKRNLQCRLKLESRFWVTIPFDILLMYLLRDHVRLTNISSK